MCVAKYSVQVSFSVWCLGVEPAFFLPFGVLNKLYPLIPLFQIRGRKRWLLRPWPEMDHLTAHEFVLEEGEALFFWPDWEHSTVCLDGGHDSGCLSFHQYVETDLAHNCYLQQFLFGEPLAGRADGAAAKTAGHRRFARHHTVMRRKCHVKLGE